MKKMFATSKALKTMPQTPNALNFHEFTNLMAVYGHHLLPYEQQSSNSAADQVYTNTLYCAGCTSVDTVTEYIVSKCLSIYHYIECCLFSYNEIQTELNI